VAWIITSEVLKRSQRILLKLFLLKITQNVFAGKRFFNRLNFQNNRLNVTVISVTTEIQLWLLQLKTLTGSN